MLRWILVAMACLAGCTSTEVPRNPVAPQPQSPPRFAGPMPVTFGACSSEHTQWVSGPRAVHAVAARDPHEAAIEQARAAGLLGHATIGQGGAFASLTGSADSSSGFDDTNIYGGLLGDEAGSASGAVGWGTIGTGRYGTLGHGNRNLPPPRMTLGQPVAKGALDKAIIRRYVKRYRVKLQYCYEKQLLAKPGIEGTIVAHFTIAPSGDVTSAKSTGFDPDLASCVDGAVQSIQFPKPKDNGSVEVTYPIEYHPGQASAAHTTAGDLDKAIIRRVIKRNIQKIQYCYEKQLLVTPGINGTIHTQFFITPSGKVSSATGSGFDPKVASCVAGVIQQMQFPKPKGGGGVMVNYPFVFHEAGDAAPKGAGSGSAAGSSAAPAPPPPAPPPPPPPAPPHVDDPADQPSATNPLQPLSTALADCFRQNPVPYGAVVVEMHYDRAGAVSSANVYGLDGAAARACVIEVVKRARPTSTAAAQRCSLAFGQMPVSALPAIGIVNGAITFGGHSLAAPGPDSTAPTIDALVSELAARGPAANGAVVSIQGPIVVRPDDATAMNVVYDVLDSVRAAHGDFVLAAHRGAGWRLLRDGVTLPPAPVVAGEQDAPAGDPDDERVNLSVFIQTNQVWVGLSRVNEFTQIARGQDLAKVLEEEKESAFFTDRTDLEIAADDGVSYADVVSAIDAATRAGFTDWQLVRPAALSARPML